MSMETPAFTWILALKFLFSFVFRFCFLFFPVRTV